MTITAPPPRLVLTGSADYTKLEFAIPASAVDPDTKTIITDELLRHIALALDHDDGTPAEVVATILAWSDHLLRLELDDDRVLLDWLTEMGDYFGSLRHESTARADATRWVELHDDGSDPGQEADVG
jgi:hypothetical protein